MTADSPVITILVRGALAFKCFIMTLKHTMFDMIHVGTGMFSSRPDTELITLKNDSDFFPSADKSPTPSCYPLHHTGKERERKKEATVLLWVLNGLHSTRRNIFHPCLQVGEPMYIFFLPFLNWLVDQTPNSALEEPRSDRRFPWALEEVIHKPHVSALLLANSPSHTGEPKIPSSLPVAKVLPGFSAR